MTWCVSCGGDSMDDLCAVCLYRAEKARKGLPLKAAPFRSRSTSLACPACQWEVVILGRHVWKNHTRHASCTDCGYRWITTSKEAFGGTRQVEVRG